MQQPSLAIALFCLVVYQERHIPDTIASLFYASAHYSYFVANSDDNDSYALAVLLLLLFASLLRHAWRQCSDEFTLLVLGCIVMLKVIELALLWIGSAAGYLPPLLAVPSIGWDVYLCHRQHRQQSLPWDIESQQPQPSIRKKQPGVVAPPGPAPVIPRLTAMKKQTGALKHI